MLAAVDFGTHSLSARLDRTGARYTLPAFFKASHKSTRVYRRESRCMSNRLEPRRKSDSAKSNADGTQHVWTL